MCPVDCQLAADAPIGAHLVLTAAPVHRFGIRSFPNYSIYLRCALCSIISLAACYAASSAATFLNTPFVLISITAHRFSLLSARFFRNILQLVII